MPKAPAIYARTSAEFRDRFINAARMRGSSMKSVLLVLAQGWLDRDESTEYSASSSAGYKDMKTEFPRERMAILRRVDSIYASGNTEAISMIEMGLQMAEMKLEQEKAKLAG